MSRDKEGDSFERKGGYPSARAPRSEMKPPPASASQPAQGAQSTNQGSGENGK